MPGTVMSFHAIGRELGCSRSRAEQIFNGAMRKLRHNPRMRQLLLLAKSKECEG